MLSDQQASAATGQGNPDNDLDRLPVVIASVAANYERLPFPGGQGVENRLYKIFQVMRRTEHADGLAQARGARPLVTERSCVYRRYVHGLSWKLADPGSAYFQFSCQ